MLLDRQQERLTNSLSLSLSAQRQDVARLAAALDALSPLKVLGRGYAIAQGPKGIVKSVKDVKAGDDLELQLTDGRLRCEVKP